MDAFYVEAGFSGDAVVRYSLRYLGWRCRDRVILGILPNLDVE